MLFKNASEVTPCGMFSISHLLLLILTVYFIAFAFKKTKNSSKSEVRTIIRKSTILLWILEIIKIIYSIKNFGPLEVNKYVPLYFCSLILYAGILSGFTKGKLKRTGDVFLSTGGLIAGTAYLICPLTSLTTYPFYHFITFQSFFLHGLMVYLGLIMLKTNYITLKKQDIKYYFILICLISFVALIFNFIMNSNLMFVSQNYPGTFIEIIYNITGNFFSLFMILVQATLPFIVVYVVSKKITKKEELTYNKVEDNLDNFEISENAYSN